MLLARLVLKVSDSPRLGALVASLNPERPLQRFAVCITLRAFITLAPYVHAPTQWVEDAKQIREVLGC